MGPVADAHAPVEFTLALKQRNLDILDQWFWEVSDPTHPNYQDFKSIDEISSLVSPRAEEVAPVLQWLHAAGVHHANVKSLGDALEVKTTVKHASKLFETKFHSFAHSKTGAKVVRQFGSYSVPTHLKGMIEMVTGLSSFPIPHLEVKRPNASNDYGIIPQTVDNLYQVSQAARSLLKKKSAAAGTSQAVIEFEGQNFTPSVSDSCAQAHAHSTAA